MIKSAAPRSHHLKAPFDVDPGSIAMTALSLMPGKAAWRARSRDSDSWCLTVVAGIAVTSRAPDGPYITRASSVAKLYLPSGGKYFGSRAGYG